MDRILLLAALLCAHADEVIVDANDTLNTKIFKTATIR